MTDTTAAPLDFLKALVYNIAAYTNIDRVSALFEETEIFTCHEDLLVKLTAKVFAAEEKGIGPARLLSPT